MTYSTVFTAFRPRKVMDFFLKRSHEMLSVNMFQILAREHFIVISQRVSLMRIRTGVTRRTRSRARSQQDTYFLEGGVKCPAQDHH